MERRGIIGGERYADSLRWFWIASAFNSLVLVLFLTMAIPSYGWWPLLIVGLPALAGSLYIREEADTSLHAYASGHLGWLLCLGISASLTGGADSFLLPLLPVCLLGFFGRLPPLLAFGYAWLSFVLATGIVLVTDWSGFVRSPWLLTTGAVGALSLTLFAAQMAAGEIRHRAEATIDQLTGLLNRRGLEERIAELGQQALVIGKDTPMALVAGDLDHFKAINDTHGHAAGDAVLRDVAYLIRKHLRRFELAYRMGGEEFLIVLPGYDSDSALVLAESLRAAIEEATPGGLKVTISMGVAVCPAADLPAARLLESADAAVYAAKHAGRNRVVLAEPGRDGAQAEVVRPPVDFSI